MHYELVENWMGQKIRRETIHMDPVKVGDLELLELYSYRHVWAQGDGQILPRCLFDAVYNIIPRYLRDNHITVRVRCYGRNSLYLTFSDGNCWWTPGYEPNLRVDGHGRMILFDGGQTKPEDLKIIGIGDVLEELWGDDWRAYPKYDDQWEAGVGEWFKENEAYYYARPREYFFKHEAIELACRAGKKVLVLEDMS